MSDIDLDALVVSACRLAMAHTLSLDEPDAAFDILHAFREEVGTLFADPDHGALALLHLVDTAIDHLAETTGASRAQTTAALCNHVLARRGIHAEHFGVPTREDQP